MKITLNPEYAAMKKYVESIPNFFEGGGREIYVARNVIKVFEDVGREVINVKRYHRPNFFNRVVYSFLRAPKGRRAYEYALRLLAEGFETPEPIAYIEERRCGLIGYSYFVSVQSPYKYRLYQFGDADPQESRGFIKAFAQYTASLHKAGILHNDYSPGNILFDEVEGEYRFSLVDINRMSFGEVTVEQGCANFARLWGQKAFFELLADEYAAARGADADFCREKVLHYRRKFWRRQAKKHTVKYRLEL